MNERGSRRIWLTLGTCFMHRFGVGADKDGSDFIESNPCPSGRHRCGGGGASLQNGSGLGTRVAKCSHTASSPRLGSVPFVSCLNASAPSCGFTLLRLGLEKTAKCRPEDACEPQRLHSTSQLGPWGRARRGDTDLARGPSTVCVWAAINTARAWKESHSQLCNRQMKPYESHRRRKFNRTPGRDR